MPDGILLERAEAVLKANFPEWIDSLHLQLPDEDSRRVGQTVAAASLLEIPLH